MGGLYSKLFRSTKSTSEYVQTEETVVLRKDSWAAVNSTEGVSTPQFRIIKNSLLDPRSATVGIVRTPLVLASGSATGSAELCRDTTIVSYLEVTPPRQNMDKAAPVENDLRTANASSDPDNHSQEEPETDNTVHAVSAETDKPKQSSFLSRLDTDERSAQLLEEISDGPIAVAKEAMETVNYWIDDEDEQLEEEEDGEQDEAIIERLERDRTLDLLKKKLFLTPEPSKMECDAFIDGDCAHDTTPRRPGGPKSGRTPLGNVCHNRVGAGNKTNAGKGWKVMSEERVRLGLENTPPHLMLLAPLQDKVQSAPPSNSATRIRTMMMKQHHNHPGRAHWDTDNTILI